MGLYTDRFENNKKHMAYGEESQYWQDLFQCLDLLFLEGGWMHPPWQEEKQPEHSLKDGIAFASSHIRSRLEHTSEKEDFRFRILMKRMKFTEWEQFLFLLSFAVCREEKYAQLCMRFPGNEGNKAPTLAMAATVYEILGTFSGMEWADAIQKNGVLFRCFLDTSCPAEDSHTQFTMLLNGRVLAYLYGKGELGTELRDLAEVFRYTDALEKVRVRQETRDALSGYMEQIAENACQTGNVIDLYGPPGIGKKFLLQSAAKAQKQNLLFVDARRILLATIEELRILLDKIRLECILLPAIPCFVGYEKPEWTEGEEETWRQEQIPQGLCFLLSHIRRDVCLTVWIGREKADFLREYGLRVFHMELPLLTASERGGLWEAYSGAYLFQEEVDIPLCASQYILTPRDIKDVLWDAGLRAAGRGDAIGKNDLRDAVARQRGNQFGGMADFIPSTYSWEDLIVSDGQREQLEMICDRVKYRGLVEQKWGFYRKTPYGRGICALFYGPPGTGKTMAAQVIAGELGLMLYRVDISRLISKYIGETEKHITELFRRAGNTNAILFFDEADALFSKRSEVKDSLDRNANTQTAHLLQKLENYDGISILATNLIGNMDDAFKRRIKFMVHFVFPDAGVRLELFRALLPEDASVEEEIDISFFAEEFELSGSSIKEVLTGAAFFAAAKGRGMRNEDVVKAVRLHFAKYGRVLGEEAFGYLGEG